MARRIDKLQINALNASNNQILVVRSGELAFDDTSNVFSDSGTNLTGNTTTDLAEGNNLYYTNARVGSYVNTFGFISGIDLSANTTTDLAEGDNLYYTNARVGSYLSENDVTVQSLTVQGDLTVQGNTTTLNTATLVIEDKNIVLANGALNSAAADGAGITIDGAQANITYVSTGDKFTVNKVLEVQGFSVLTANSSTTDIGEGNNLYYTNARVLAHLAESNVSAKSFITTGAGTPSLVSENNLILSANGLNAGAVIIQSSPLRLRSYTTADRGNITAANGDVIFNSSENLIQVYSGNAWANVGATDISGFTTTDLAEGDNLYYTNARVYSNVSPLLNLKADVSDLTTANVAELTNLYYTNARVISALIAGDNITIESNGRISSAAGGGGDLTSVSSNVLPSVTETYNLGSADKRWKDLYLAGNTIVLGNVTLSDQAGKLKLDSLEAGELTIDRLSLYTAGRGITISGSGIIATSADDSELYDIGIDKQVTYFPTDSMETAFSTPGTAGFKYLIQSFVVTNISGSDATFFCDVEHQGNTYAYANNFILPYGYSIDLVERPEIFHPNTIVKMRAVSNNTISTYVIYKSVDDDSYETQFTTIAAANTFQTIYTASQASAIVENIKVINKTNTLLRGTITLLDSNAQIKAYVLSNTLLAKQYYTDSLIRPLRLEVGDSIQFANFNGEANGITTVVNARLGEIYTITPNVTTLDEGKSVTFAVTTVNVPSNTTRYYRTSGNVSSSDFVEANTGSFIIVDNAANITLTLVNDSSYNENDEAFVLQILNAAQGSVLKSSETIVIKDTSNVAAVQSVDLSSNSIYTTESVIFTINTTGAAGNAGATFYYTTTGNADIYLGNTGSIIINDNIANLELIAEATGIGSEQRQFALQIRKDSVSGEIVLTTENVIVKDISTFDANVLLDSIVATGGTIQEIEE